MTEQKTTLGREPTNEERSVLAQLYSQHDAIVEGFRKVLQDNGIENLHVYSYSLDEKKRTGVIPDNGCSCMHPPPHYAIPCSLCSSG